MDILRDPITWRQVGVAYLIMACLWAACLLAFYVPWFNPRDPLHSAAATGCFVALGGLWSLGRPLVLRAGEALAPPRAARQWMKAGAVAALCALSLLLCALAILHRPLPGAP